ncbi:MAG: hypothetical protein ACI395_05255 [Candidatus Cryptobacteroides sp.]
MNRQQQTFYTPPQVTLYTAVCPERVICDSIFDNYDLDREDTNSADNGYGKTDNGDY